MLYLKSQKPRSKLRGIKIERSKAAGYLPLAAVAKCLKDALHLLKPLGSLLAGINATLE